MQDHCEECNNDEELYQCEYCHGKFCVNHKSTHLAAKLCQSCNKNVCLEMFSSGRENRTGWNPTYCFRCNSSKILSDIETRSNNLLNSDCISPNITLIWPYIPSRDISQLL